MPKRWIVVGLLSVLLLSVSVSAAQEATPEATVSPALIAQMASLEQYTEQVRGLTLKQPIEHRFPSRQQTIAYLQSSYDRQMPQEQLDKLTLFYVALGLLPADVNLHDVYLSLLDSQVAGFYDPDTKTMNVIPVAGNSVGSTLSLEEQIIYVHEFTHALQDQYFDLNKMESPEVEAVPDRSLAVTALIEGDATSTMTVYTEDVEQRDPLAGLSLLIEGVQAGNLTLPSGVPSALVNELLFPYTQGLNFVLALYQSGGEDAINAAFRNPPTTSEQILHPEKYLAGEGAQDVALPDQSAALGAGWQAEWDSPLGEFYLQEYLATELSDSDATAAAAGWGGDHFIAYRDDASGQIAYALRIAWDTPADQSEFDTLYAQYGAKRFGSSASDGCWQSTTAALCLVSSGSDDLIVSAPTLAQAQTLAAA